MWSYIMNIDKWSKNKEVIKEKNNLEEINKKNKQKGRMSEWVTKLDPESLLFRIIMISNEWRL